LLASSEGQKTISISTADQGNLYSDDKKVEYFAKQNFSNQNFFNQNSVPVDFRKYQNNYGQSNIYIQSDSQNFNKNNGVL
jgi:hypothetical protein